LSDCTSLTGKCRETNILPRLLNRFTNRSTEFLPLIEKHFIGERLTSVGNRLNIGPEAWLKTRPGTGKIRSGCSEFQLFTGPDKPIDRTKEINRREASQTGWRRILAPVSGAESSFDAGETLIQAGN
jgi:hypothetical protein